MSGQDLIQGLVLLSAIVASYVATIQRIAVLETKVEIYMRKSDGGAKS